MKFINHGLQRNFLHRLLDCIFYFMIRGFQNFANVLRYRARPALTGMNPNDGGHTIWFQCRIDLVQGDLGWISAQLCTAGSTENRNKPCFFSALRILRITTGLLPVLSAKRLLVTLAIPFASWIKIRQ